MFIFNALIQIRQNALKTVAHLNNEQLNKIPAQCSNNIIWHLGHMMASQQILCYVRSGATPRLSAEMIDKYRKGTSPANWGKMVDMEEVKPLFIETAAVFQKDYESGVFAQYEQYTTASGIVLNTIDEAVAYSYGHENLHFGNISTMVKMLR